MESIILSIFIQEIDNCPNWDTMKEVLSGLFIQLQQNKMQRAISVLSDDLKGVKGFKVKTLPQGIIGKLTRPILKLAN